MNTNKRKELTKKILAVTLCFLTLFMGMPLPVCAQIATLETQKDTAADFNAFIASCSMEERAQLMQALEGLDIKLKDSYFGTLNGLPSLSNFTTDKKQASTTMPLKPKTFNEVLPATVVDAIKKGEIKEEVISREKICEQLEYKRYKTIRSWFIDADDINYHEDIVKWVAEEKGIEKEQRNTLSTYQLERKITEKYFADLWDKLTEEQRIELLSKIEKDSNSFFTNKAALAGMGGAAAIGVLSTTVAFTGFAFYTTMSTVICTVAGLVGVTLPFAAYTAASSTVAVLTGPIGWAIGGVLLATGATIAWSWPDSDTVAAFVMVLNAIKASRLESFKLNNNSSGQNNQNRPQPPYGQQNPYGQNTYGQNNTLIFQMNPYGQNRPQNPYGQQNPYEQNPYGAMGGGQQGGFGGGMMPGGQGGFGGGFGGGMMPGGQGGFGGGMMPGGQNPYGQNNPNVRNDSRYSQGQAQQGSRYVENEAPKDNPDAFSMWKNAAEQGNVEAMYNLGKYYHYGYVVEKNYPEAVKWYKKAAEKGNVLAQYQLGICYRDGFGDYATAMEWLRKAADQGNNADAQYELGYCYEYRMGNKNEARIWYRKAADQRNEKASKALRKL